MVEKLTSGLQDPPAPVQSKGRKRKQLIEHVPEANPDPSLYPDAKRQRTSPTRPAEDAFGEPAIGSDAYTHTRFQDRLDEDFFRTRRRRSMVKSVVEVSSGQYCSCGQRPSFTQKATA